MNFHELAEEKFGDERAAELWSDIEALQADIEKLRSVPLEFDDEP